MQTCGTSSLKALVIFDILQETWKSTVSALPGLLIPSVTMQAGTIKFVSMQWQSNKAPVIWPKDGLNYMLRYF